MTSVLSYTNLKTLHIACVILTYSLFFARGILMVARPPALQARWARVMPHIVDSVLLAAAIGMLVIAQLNPLRSPWLVAKIVGLLLYIGIGTVALKRGRTLRVRLTAWLLAQVVLLYIVAVAFVKNPWPF